MKKDYSGIPFAPGKFPFFYGWVIVLLSSIGMLMSIPGQTMGVSAFTEHLIKALKIDRTDLTLAYMFGTITSSFVLTYAGKVYDRFGARVLCCFASIGLGLTLIVLSQSAKLAEGLYASGLGKYAVVVMMLIGFFMLRFFGQGVMMLGSRNMMMKWFDRRRGLVTGLSGPIVSLGFSVAPLTLNFLIRKYEWSGAWLLLGLISLFIFSAIVLIFFRDNPEGCGLLPDGSKKLDLDINGSNHIRQYTLSEARRHWPFWIYASTLALLGYFITAVTFHIVSIFAHGGMDAKTAFSIFFPAALISVSINLICGYLSDRAPMKYFVMLALGGVIISSLALCFLSPGITVYVLIVGNGISGGLFGIISNVTFPRFYGRKHLGAINGFIMSLMVFSSAVAPWVFSKSLDLFGTYRPAEMLCAAIAAALLFGAIKADKPREQEHAPA